MGLKAYISEEEAARIAGVSVSTLNSFVEAGYLTVEQDLEDGLSLFSKEEVAKLFGVSLDESAEESANSFIGGEFGDEEVRESEVPSRNRVVTSGKERSFVRAVANENGNSAAIFSSSAELKQGVPRSSEREFLVKGGASVLKERGESNRVVYLTYGESSKDGEDSSGKCAVEQKPNTTEDSLEELVKLRHLCKLLERTLAIREEQLKEARGERDWLRKRLSLLEERIGRDQLLLLSEAQMIKGMIEERKRKREVSLINRLFKWFFGTKGGDVPKALPAGKASES